MLSIRNLTIEFTNQTETVVAARGVNLEIPQGKTIGLVGESGSGKSVTALSILRLLNRSAKISSGEILFKGKDLLKLPVPELRKIRGNQISMIFQEPMTSLNPVFTIGNQIGETLRLHQNLNRKEARERTLELLESVKIPQPLRRIDSYPHELSGGQKQRAMIAIAMACKPDLLIADEPTTALDVTIQRQVMDLMLELQRKHQMSLLFITHDLALIGDLADEVAVMHRGEIVEKNSTKEIFQNPRHPYTQGLLSCRPRLGNHPKRLPTVSDFLENPGLAASHAKTQVNRVPKAPSEPVLVVKNLEKHFPIRGGIFKKTRDWVKAVDGVSLTVEKGKTLGLVGESGCGKTTLGRTILRLLTPTQGQVLFKGQDITSLSENEMRKMRRKMQIIFQDPYSSLNPRMTVQDMLTEPMKIHEIGSSLQERTDRAANLLKKVGLGPAHLNRYAHEFSGGQRQRLCIARALTVEPEFIVCDESVSALDVSIQAQILNLLLDLQDEMGLTYIFISHDLSVVSFIADDVAVMKDGKIIERAPADQLYRDPQNAYTRELLSSIPKGTEKASLL